MGKRTSYQEGTFCWVDLATTDTDAAKGFYSELMGWTFEDKPTPYGPYCIASHQGQVVTALSGMPPGWTQPCWTSCIAVNDVDTATKKAMENGATVMMEPMDVMEEGRMVMLKDPTGAPVSFWQKKNFFGAEFVNHPGGFCWNELWTEDSTKAKNFFATMFGWEYDEQTEPNPYITIKNKGAMNGGMMDMSKNPPEKPMPAHWNVYFSVENTDATIEKAVGLGGKLLFGPIDIPVGRFAAIADPQGSYFTIIQMPEIDD